MKKIMGSIALLFVTALSVKGAVSIFVEYQQHLTVVAFIMAGALVTVTLLFFGIRCFLRENK